MADVFISYAKQDGDCAQKLAAALRPHGWSVWWDRHIVAGQAFDQAIEHELEIARSVVVLWSMHSIASEWVKNEAAAASERGVLVPARIEDVKLPIEFRRKQTADLIGWNGEEGHPGFQALCEGLSAAIGGAGPLRHGGPEPHDSTRGQEPKRRRGAPLILAAAVIAVAIGLGLGVYAPGRWRATPPPRAAQRASSGAVESGGGEHPVRSAAGPADLAVGTYVGAVIADSHGSSRSDVQVTIARVDKWTVRVTSDYARLGAREVTLTRIDDKVLSAGGDTALVLDIAQDPPTLDYNPQGIAYRGKRR